MNHFFLSRVRYLAGTISLLCFILSNTATSAQKTNIDGKEFQPYRASHFRPHRGLFYQLYVSPVVTVDPLGISGPSTYGIALGSRINLWESKMPDKKLSGLKMKGLYLAAGYEYYPQQYDMIYGSLWLRIKTFMPIAAKADLIYATGYGLKGITYRFCVGFEVKTISIFFCGSISGSFYNYLGPHPNTESPYGNAGSILAIIPVFTRKVK